VFFGNDVVFRKVFLDRGDENLLGGHIRLRPKIRASGFIGALELLAEVVHQDVPRGASRRMEPFEF